MNILRCKECSKVFISGGSNYCNFCSHFENLIQEKVAMVLDAIKNKGK